MQTKSKSLSGTGAPVIINAPPAESLASLIAPTIPPIEISPPAGAGVAMGGEVLMNLERERAAETGAGAPVIITNNSTSQINQSSPIVLPSIPIVPGNNETSRIGEYS